MAKSFNLQGFQDSIYYGKTRKPIFKIQMFDESDTISNICLGKHTQVPKDLTKFVESFNIQEVDEEAATCDIKLFFPERTLFSPYDFVGRKIIKIFYADAQAISDFQTEMVCIFFGVITGQPAFSVSRGKNNIDLQCVDRSFFYSKKTLETPEFLQNTDFGDVLTEIAQNNTYGFALQREEIRFGKLFSTVQHSVISFVDVGFFEGLNFVGFLFDKKADFDREGFLIMRDNAINKPPIRKYSDESLFVDFSWEPTDLELINRIIIKGLSNVVSKVVSPVQKLATVTGTIGFFQDEFNIRVFFSEDKDTRAENVFISETKIGGQLDGVFGGKASLKTGDEFSVILVVSCPFQSYIFIAFFVVYIAFFAVELIFGFLGDTGTQLAAAIWLCAGLAIMQQMGTFEVEISGEPFRMVFKEIESIADWENLETSEIRDKEIENHLIHTQELADTIAKRELVRETLKGQKRKLVIPYDPVLEKYDIIELPDGTHYFIESISVSYNRGSEGFNMDLGCINVRNGKEYNQINEFSLY